MRLTRESHRVLSGEVTTHWSLLGLYVVIFSVLFTLALVIAGAALVMDWTSWPVKL